MESDQSIFARGIAGILNRNYTAKELKKRYRVPSEDKYRLILKAIEIHDKYILRLFKVKNIAN